MTNFSMKSLLKPLFVMVFAAALGATTPGLAQTSQKLQPRITAPVDDSNRVSVHGMSPALAIKEHDLGAVDPSTKINGITLLFSRTPAQQADLDALFAAQQDINSPLYHQWLTPEQFGARFGMSADDIAKVQAWLQGEGFTINRVAHASNFIVFDGTAGLIESALGAPIHNYKLADGSVHFAPANDLTFPAAIAPSVQFVQGLNTFRHRAHYHKSHRVVTDLHPNWTDINNPYTPYLLTPPDLETLYDINAAYKAGYTGAGQSIAVLGVSYILPSDITNFQTLVGMTPKLPIYTLVPDSGAPYRSPGDEGESDLDVEYSSTIAKGAQVYFVYTGFNYNNGTDDANLMAVDQRIAQVITVSYGDCELDDDLYYAGTSYFTTQDAIYQQAGTQGQSLMNAASDAGSPDCNGYAGEDGVTLAQSQAPWVDYPAASPYQTAVGGTGFPQADFGSGANVATYWTNNSSGGAPLTNSLKKYVPEVVWNDDDPYFSQFDGLSAGGGGSSAYEPTSGNITWQAQGSIIGGVAIPVPPQIGGKTKYYARMVPDVALMASNESPGMLVCSSDPDSLESNQVNSCSATSWYDSVSGDLTIFGGTSFGGPILSGITAILNQALNSNGLGLLNPTLYSIAENATNYPLAFHDITVGSNSCYDYTFNDAEYGVTGYPAPPAPMPGVCGVTSAAAGPSPPADYGALTGYDMASGLGSLDVNNLIAAWPKPASYSLIATTTTGAYATYNPALSTNDAITFSVTPTAATGTVAVTVDGVAATTLTLATGTAPPYNFASAILGTHSICGTYSGDTTHAVSSSCLIVFAGSTTPPVTNAFNLTAPSLTVAPGAAASSSITVTSVGSYVGIVNFTFTNGSTTSPLNICLSATPVTITKAGAVATSTLTVTTNTTSGNCTTGTTPLLKHVSGGVAKAAPAGKSPWKRAPLPVAMAGLLLLLCVRRRSSLLRVGISLGLVVVFSLAGLGLTGCSSSSSANNGTSTPVTPPTNPNASPAGTYTIIITGTDAASSTLTTSATFSLTIS